MSDLAIRAENLSKQYRIGALHRHNTLRDQIVAIAKNVARPQDHHPDNGKTIWALQNVSFEISQGEVIGVIGRNGAGKSTLLKILSRITKPTSGSAVIRGRVGSLLEVGTGFHSELTGRENIYMNGAILGMTRSEIKAKFDEIVVFAEVEKFIDTPVKRYSSGMYMRLAFAVAAHLEPDILLIDEVLAVGDASFQKKCLNKMEDIGHTGRAVLFVSHNMPAVARLCPRAILLDGGRLVADGPMADVVGIYLRSDLGTTAERTWPDVNRAPQSDVVRLCAARVKTREGRITSSIDISQPISLEIEYDVLQPGHVMGANFHFFNEEGVNLFVVADNADPVWKGNPRQVGHYISKVWIPGNFLAEGTITVSVYVSTPTTLHAGEPDAIAFQVIDNMNGNTARGDYAGPMPGVVRPMLQWENQFTPARTEDTIGANPT